MVTKELNETQDTYIFLFLASLSCEKAALWGILRRRQSYKANLVPRVISYPSRRAGKRTWERGCHKARADGERRGRELGRPVPCSSSRPAGSRFTGYAFCVAIFQVRFSLSFVYYLEVSRYLSFLVRPWK